MTSQPFPSDLRMPLRESAVSAALALALPLLVLVVYTNASDIFIRDFGIPSVLQPLIALLALLVWVFRRILKPSEIFLQPLTLLLAAYCFVLFLSSLWARDVALTDERIAEAVKSLAIYVLVGCLAFSKPALRRGLAALTVAAAVLAVLTITQTVTGTANEFGGFAQLKVGTVYNEVEMARGSGPVDDPNFYGQLLLIALPLATFLAITTSKRRWKIAFAAAAVTILAGTVLTYSRGAIVAIGMMVVLLIFAVRMRPRYIVAAIAIAILLVAAMPGAVVQRALSMRDAMSSSSGEHDPSIDERKLFLGTAWEMFNAHPIVGVGAGNYSTFFNRYSVIVGSPVTMYHDRGDPAFPHNLYLQIAAENGMLGLLIFLAAVVAAFLTLRRARQQPGERAGITTALAIALAGYLTSALFLHGAYQRNFWILLGCVAAIRRIPKEEVAL